MKKVWKYKVTLELEQDIELPVGCKILALNKQGNRNEDEIYLWCLIDPDSPMETRHFLLTPTFEELPENILDYVGTLWLMNGSYVLHLFRLP